MRSFRFFRLQHLLALNIPLILVLCLRILEKVYFSRLRFLGTCLSLCCSLFLEPLGHCLPFPCAVWLTVCPPAIPGAPTPHPSSPGCTHHTVLFVVQSLSHVWLFETPWIAAYQASLSLTLSHSLLRLMSTESMVPSDHLILYHPLLLLPSVFPSIRAFPMSQFFPSGGQSIGASASASVLPMIIQGWLPLGLTGLISLLSKGLSRYSVLHFLFPLKIVLKIDSSASVFFLHIPQSFVLSFFLDS